MKPTNLIVKSLTSSIFILLRINYWLCEWWFAKTPNSIQIGHTFIQYILHLVRHHGIKEAIARIKLIRLIVTRYMCGQPIKVVEKVIAINKSGWPRCLSGLQKYVDSNDVEAIRMILTFLNYSKCLETIGHPSFDVINDPSTADVKVIDDIATYIPSFIKENKIPSYTGAWTKQTASLSTKAGPHGLSTWTAWKSAFFLPTALLNALQIVGGGEIVEFVHDIRKSFPQEVMLKLFKALRFKEGGLRKLAYVNDPELKCRVVAVLDWFSQESLRPFHEYIFSILKNMPRDRTFTQLPHIKFKSQGQCFHSLDLSSATDRFPMALQVKLVESLTSSAFAEAWNHILTAYPYEGNKPYGGQHVYRAGQPMGGYSSWAVFTLCHHLVVYYSIQKAKDTRKGIVDLPYILLGDDIVICDDTVAMIYKDTIRSLGVELSEMKSHTSEDTYEFAKRWFRRGVEVTGIPAKGFAHNISKVHILYMNLRALYDRGYHTPVYITIPDLIRDLLLSDDKLSDKYIDNLHRRAKGLDAVHRYVHMDDKETLYNMLRLSLPWDIPVPSSLEQVLREGMNDILAANVDELHNYCNKYMNSIRETCERLADQTNGWIPNVIQYGKLPVTVALFVRTRENVQKLIMPAAMQPLKEIIKTTSLDDPSRITSVRNSVKLFGTQSRLYKKIYNSI